MAQTLQPQAKFAGDGPALCQANGGEGHATTVGETTSLTPPYVHGHVGMMMPELTQRRHRQDTRLPCVRRSRGNQFCLGTLDSSGDGGNSGPLERFEFTAEQGPPESHSGREKPVMTAPGTSHPTQRTKDNPMKRDKTLATAACLAFIQRRDQALPLVPPVGLEPTLCRF